MEVVSLRGLALSDSRTASFFYSVQRLRFGDSHNIAPVARLKFPPWDLSFIRYKRGVKPFLPGNDGSIRLRTIGCAACNLPLRHQPGVP